MAAGRRKLEWDQTADLLAMLYNGLFRPAEPQPASTFNPMAEHEPEDIPEVPLTSLRTLFVR